MNTDRRAFIKSSLILSGTALLSNPLMVLAQDGAAKDNAPQAPFTFAVIADPHCGEPGAIDKFFACIEAIEKLSDCEKADFILILGDIHLWVLKKHFHKIPIPLHVISGNHEGPDKKKQMRELFPLDFNIDGKESDYYSFVHKNVRFIGVCNASAGDHIGTFCSEDFGPRGQCEWLENQLAQKEPHKIIFGHIPPEPNGQDRNMFLSRNDSRWLIQLVKDTRPAAMFFGHQHTETIKETLGTTPCFTVRSCCWNTNKAPTGFMLVTVTAEGISTHEILTAPTPPKTPK